MKEAKNTTNMNRTFIMAKVKPEETDINKAIKEGFEDPYNYLKLNSNVIVGRSTKGPRFDANKNLIPYSVIGDPALFESVKRLNRNNPLKHFLSKAINSMNSLGTSHKKDSKRPYDYVEDEKISEMFDNIEKEIDKNKSDQKYSNEYLDDIPLNIKKELNIQESSLHSKNKSLDYSINISKYLAKKSKKNEEDLLMNRVDQLRMKREFEELILNKNITSYENNVPVENWMMNLRQTKNNNIPSTSYIYYGDVYNPYWVPVREKKQKSTDIIRNPLSKIKTDFKSFIKNNSIIDKTLIQNNEVSNNTGFNTTNNNMLNSFNSFSFLNSNGDSKNFSCTSSLNNFNNNLTEKEMIIKGKSLLKTEINLANQLSGRKIMYKKGYLDTHLYGHFTSLNPIENEKNIASLSSPINILSNYSSPYSKKTSPMKIKLLK